MWSNFFSVCRANVTSAYAKIYICKFSCNLTTHLRIFKCRICTSIFLRGIGCFDLYRSFVDIDCCASVCIRIAFQACLKFYSCFSILCSCRTLIQCIVTICILILDGCSFKCRCCRHSKWLSIICLAYVSCSDSQYILIICLNLKISRIDCKRIVCVVFFKCFFALVNCQYFFISTYFINLCICTDNT